MAEIKRINLNPFDNGQSSKKSNKTTKHVAPSFRFEINLIDSNDEKYTEVNYAQLLENAEKKKRKEKKKSENPTNGFLPFGKDEEDDKVLDVARYYEEKYGIRKQYEYADLGAGYDENDSFIDNTDAYDEIVPEEMTTIHGGFYVNSGPLEFKNSDKEEFKNSENSRNLKNNVNANNEEEENDDDDEEDESDEDESSSDGDTDDQMSSKKTNKRCLSSSENEETEKLQPPKSKVCITGIEQQPQQQQQQQPPKITIRTDLTEHQQPVTPRISTDDAECVIID